MNRVTRPPFLRILVGALLAAGVGLATGTCGNLTSGGFGEVEVILTSQAVEELEGAVRRAVSLSPVAQGEALGADP